MRSLMFLPMTLGAMSLAMPAVANFLRGYRPNPPIGCANPRPHCICDAKNHHRWLWDCD